MKALKTLVLAAVAAASLATAAEAGQKKHGFYYEPHWVGKDYSDCWEYRKVPKFYYAKVRYKSHGEVRWKKVKKVRYVNERYYTCDVYAY